jgi:hypothetical protein
MSRTKHPSKGRRSKKALSVLGVAGLSLAAMPSQAMTPFQVTPLGEEDITDVTLATFHTKVLRTPNLPAWPLRQPGLDDAPLSGAVGYWRS